MKVTEFGQLRSQLQVAARKQQGSLAVRDLSGLVPPGQLVDTENLTTLLVVVPKAAKGDWVAQYEALTDFVVPRSSEVGAADARGWGPADGAGAGWGLRACGEGWASQLPRGHHTTPHHTRLTSPTHLAQVVAEDADYLVFTVVLFRRAVDNFKAAARTKGFQARCMAAAAGRGGGGGAGVDHGG